jgi:hypothetical protein
MTMTDLRTQVERNRDLSDVEEDTTNATIVGSTIAIPTQTQAILRQLVTLTTTALGIGAVFTGPTIDAIDAKYVTGMVTSDVGGTLDLQLSDDGSTWYTPTARVTDTTEAVAASAPIEVAANEVRSFILTAKVRYLRLRYTNGAVAQTSFRLSGYLAAA